MMLSVPGPGRHIEKTIMFQSRLQQSIFNLAQMKAIHTYMLGMIENAEQHSRVSR